jgi:competence protein ComEC
MLLPAGTDAIQHSDLHGEWCRVSTPWHAIGWQIMRSVFTRFRAYQLGSAGSSFSYYAGGHFTMMEGRLTDLSRASVRHEMEICDVSSADTLHVTSWDADHCAASELEELLELTRPTRIECPGYDPHCDHADDCLAIIRGYRDDRRSSNKVISVHHITPDYIDGLGGADALAFKNIFYHPRWIDPDCNNNNSTVKLFRSGSFNVLSLGDVESQNLSAQLRRSKYISRETDVMILAHHGADNGFTNRRFLSAVEPSLAICSSDYDNRHDHPSDEVRALLREQNILLLTTKTGDAIVKSTDVHTGLFRAINLKANSTEISSKYDFRSKKAELLAYNADTIRQLYAATPHHRR